MRQEVHLRDNVFFKGAWTDQLVFALLENEWRQQEHLWRQSFLAFKRRQRI